MAKYYGTIGYSISKETKPGVWVNDIVSHPSCGDIFKDSRKLENSNNLNKNLNIANRVSIVIDNFAMENFQHIVYAEFMGALWTVTTVDVEYPRLILTLGGLYNGN